MATYPSISIIIPLYNVAEYIEQCLQSVVNQTYKGEIECIIVDDCGTDDSLFITEQFIADYKGPITFRLLHHDHNRGLSAARNTGVAEATGEYIYFLDSDDYISDDCLEKLAEPLTEYDYDMVVGNLKTFGEPCAINYLAKDTGALFGKDIFYYFYQDRQIYVMAWNKLVKANLFQKCDLSFLEGQLQEDELWTYKVVAAIQSLFVQSTITYYYRQRLNSITSNKIRTAQKHFESCYHTLLHVLSHRNATPQLPFEKCVIYYFSVLLNNVEIGMHFYKKYRHVRILFNYHPLQRWREGIISMLDLKHQLHFILPPCLGYIYLQLKCLKNSIHL